MDRRHFLSIPPALLAAAALARPLEPTSIGSRPPAVFITVIAPPALFVAGREAISAVCASSLLPENTTIRLRSWWEARLDPGCPEMIHFTDDADYVDKIANGHVVTIETSGSLNSTHLVHAIPKRRRSFTRVVSERRERSVWPEMTAILREREGDATIVRVPAYWDQQFWHQVARAPAADSYGYRMLDAVGELGHVVRDIFLREERNLSHITALALLRTASAPRRPTELAGVCMLALVHCITDEQGLRSTRIEAA